MAVVVTIFAISAISISIIIIKSERMWPWGLVLTMVSATTFRQQLYLPSEGPAVPRMRELELEDMKKTDRIEDL